MSRVLVPIALVVLFCTPASATDTAYDLEPRFTLGLDDDVLLGRPVDVALHPDGSLLVLDQQLAHVLVVDEGGRRTRILGREGQGPGELTSPFDLHLEPDGTIAVAQTPPARLERFDVDGSVLESVPLDIGPGLRVPVRVHRHGKGLVSEISVVEMEGQSIAQVARLGILDTVTGEMLELADHVTEVDMVKKVLREGDTSPFSNAWAVTPRGHVAWPSDSVDYAVKRFDPASGETITLTRPDYEPRTRSDARKQEMIDASRSAMRRAGTGLQMRFVPTDLAPFARSIIARPDDSIWIRRTAESLPGFEVGAEIDTVVFDHFAADGTFVGEIRVACPAWMAEARVFVFDDTLVAIHAPDESDDEDPLRPVTIDVFTLRKAS